MFARLSIRINGAAHGFFRCGTGVRQEDPLFSLLFCLAEDVFSRGITMLVQGRKLSTILSPRGVSTPSHIFYAGDLIVSCKADLGDLTVCYLCLNAMVKPQDRL